MLSRMREGSGMARNFCSHWRSDCEFSRVNPESDLSLSAAKSVLVQRVKIARRAKNFRIMNLSQSSNVAEL